MSPEARSHRAETPNALPPGTRLGEFELLSLLGVGGFGIVYLAFDHALEREVAVKEYMPTSLAGRTETLHVSIRSQADAETFALGLKSFVNEARLLARFDHPSLLKVLRFWEGNGTAYMAMPVMRGRTVKEVRADMGGVPPEAWLRGVLDPLLGAIERLHDAGVYHRDIAPDNIQIEPDGHPVLLDFGAARRVIGDKTQSLTAILKPAYAPIEQYAEVGSVKQGPWTDLYALGATLHYLLLGRPPAPATVRAVHDDASLLTVDNLPGFSANFLHIVDWMLAPRPADRPQSVAALREALSGHSLPPQRISVEPQASQWDRTLMLSPAAAVRISHEFDDAATQAIAPTHGKPSTDLMLDEIVATDRSVAAPAAPPTPPGRSRMLPVTLGLAALTAVAAVAAGAMFWPRAPVAPGAAATAASAPEPARSALQVPPPVVSAQPESAITNVIVNPLQAAQPSTVDAGPLAERITPVAAAPVQAASTPMAREVPRSAAAAAMLAPTPAKTKPTKATVPAAEPSLLDRGSPNIQCAGLNSVMQVVCVERACKRPEFRDHVDCGDLPSETRRD